MMLFMWGMYESNQKKQYIIISTAFGVIFATTFTMLRNQTLIADVQWNEKR